MRAALSVILLLLAVMPARADECSTADDVIGWMKLEWWGNTLKVYDAGADTAAISEGINEVSAEKISPEVRYLVFTSEDGSMVRVAVISSGCYYGRIDIPAEMFSTWLKRSAL